jgi:hypothetical protein
LSTFRTSPVGVSRPSPSSRARATVPRGEAPPPPARDRTGWGATTSFPAVLVWSAAGIAAILMDAPGGLELASLALSGLAAAWGLAVFWSAGGRFITAAGIFGFGVAMFVGLAGFLSMGVTPFQPLLPVLSLSYFSALWVSTLFLRSRPPDSLGSPGEPLSEGSLRPALLIAAALLLMALTMPPEVSAALFFSAVLLMVLSFVSSRRLVAATVVGILGSIAYYSLFFDGFGRLTLGALGLALAAAFALHFQRRWIKFAILAAIAPTMVLMASLRVSLVEELNPYGDNSNAGLGSVAAPIYTGASALEIANSGLVQSGMGHTYWASAVAAIPRILWPEKPIGWGAEITPYTKPELIGTIHSEAATGFVEPYWNFGLPGIFLAIPILGAAIRGIDLVLLHSYRRPPSVATLLMGSCGILLASSLPDLIWGGSFSYMVRGGFRAGFLLLLGLPFLLIHSAGQANGSKAIPRPHTTSSWP